MLCYYCYDVKIEHDNKYILDTMKKKTSKTDMKSGYSNKLNRYFKCVCCLYRYLDVKVIENDNDMAFFKSNIAFLQYYNPIYTYTLTLNISKS